MQPQLSIPKPTDSMNNIQAKYTRFHLLPRQKQRNKMQRYGTFNAQSQINPADRFQLQNWPRFENLFSYDLRVKSEMNAKT